ncbi:hypothetical protein [uncultured Tenacibaculum sp.]|uniref:hypothetical protein n=1 Tax=uncultured Tenacibaculum sp. TaxID=174713 RepID=UPI002621F8AD|nr:hypothetical protein [uncultured Tenacibaculum sp.]
MENSLPTVAPVSTAYADLPQPAAAIHDNLIPPFNITINTKGNNNSIAKFSVAIAIGSPAPTSFEYIPNDVNHNGKNILKVTSSYQTALPGTEVNVYTYTEIDLGVNIAPNTSVFPLNYAPTLGSNSQTNDNPETARGTVVIVSGDNGGI